jgi:transcriptional regulator with XRE-family HTH domain
VVKNGMDGSLADRLRWARLEQGITLHQLSERCGRAVSYLSQLEHGIRTNPTKQTVESLAEALGVRPAFLFGEVPSPPFNDQTELVLSVQAFTLSQRFQAHWDSLPHQSRMEYSLAAPARRFAQVVRFLLEEVPHSFTRVELAWQLGMSLGLFNEILGQERDVSHPFMQQLSRVAGVPMPFLTHGTFDLVPPAAPGHGLALQYVEAIRLAQACNVSPERLEALIRAESGK